MLNLTRAQAFGITIGSALAMITAGFITSGDADAAGANRWQYVGDSVKGTLFYGRFNWRNDNYVNLDTITNKDNYVDNVTHDCRSSTYRLKGERAWEPVLQHTMRAAYHEHFC